MRLPWHPGRSRARPTTPQHRKAMSDLTDKDEAIDELLRRGNELVAALRETVHQASERLRDSVQEDDDGAG